MASLTRWVILASAIVVLACGATLPLGDLTATPDVPRLNPGEPSELVRRFVERRIAAISTGARMPGSVLASCSDLEEEYLGDGVWQVWKAIEGRKLIRVWRVDERSSEVEDLIAGDNPPCSAPAATQDDGALARFNRGGRCS